MIEQSIVHLPELVKDIYRPVCIYLVHLSRPLEANLAARTRGCGLVLVGVGAEHLADAAGGKVELVRWLLVAGRPVRYLRGGVPLVGFFHQLNV
jgi:hypothetical protein